MASGNSWNRNQNQTALPMSFNPSPAILGKEGISFLPCNQPRNETMIANLNYQNQHILYKSGYSTTQSSFRGARLPTVRASRMTQGWHTATDKLPVNESNVAENSSLTLYQPSSNQIGMINAFPPPIDQWQESRSNTTQYSYLQYRQSSEGLRMIQHFQSITDQQSENESNIHQQFNSVTHQMPSSGNGSNRNSNILIQQLSASGSQVKEALTHTMFQDEFSGNQVKYPPAHQQSERESTMHHGILSILGRHPEVRLQTPCVSDQQTLGFQNEFSGNQVKCPPAHQQSENESTMHHGILSVFVHHPADGLQNPCMPDQQTHQQSEKEPTMHEGILSILGRHYKDRTDMFQNPRMPDQKNVEGQNSYIFTNNFPGSEFKISPDLPLHRVRSMSDANSHRTLYARYSEKLNICVIGPQFCGKTDLIRTFTESDDMRTSTGKPFELAAELQMVEFETTLEICIWRAENLASAAGDLITRCGSSKSVIVLVYRAAKRDTFFTVLEWIELLKSDSEFSIPIILVGNVADITHSEIQYSDGQRAKEKYGLAAFYEFSPKSVTDANKILIFAAFQAFNRTKQK